MLEITPLLDRTSKEPLFVQLLSYIKKQIQIEKIRPGDKLPSKRKLANHLGVSLNTVENAYQQLNAEGYVQSIPREGFFVADIDEDWFNIRPVKRKEMERKTSNKKDMYKYDFNHGKVELDQFPYSVWKRLTLESIDKQQKEVFLNGDPKGEWSLRNEIANYLFQSRGVKCSPAQIVIGAGTQYLLHLLTMMLDPSYVYAMEDPGFHRTRRVLEDKGHLIRPIPLNKNGICIDTLRASDATITYVTPSHQFPTGIIMPIKRRIELLKWANEVNGYIIEDDYDGEFRYKGKPIPSLQGLDNWDRVIYLGTFSKSLIPSIRVSYMILPEHLLGNYENKLSVYKQTVSKLHQDTLQKFMKNGHWETHLNKMRRLYRRKQEVLISSINEYLKDNFEVIGEQSGLHILLSDYRRRSEQNLIQMAKEHSVKVYPTSIYYNAPHKINEHSILIGFGGINIENIHEGVRQLSKAWLD
ncbi:MocR-like pyridoxine biosynthesis transcription factor PdxR [Thalassobacillus devorans]|uniref:MocR-like pyridoxine biosynthesis transcription factor PdxR n=1 Tax=Thalassobacillus devorans TaxID=279813 RepID=UPI000A1C7EDF|nr:PLP-dependent aminotransferase family protein [Thalassobacillus devorans]